MLKLLHNLRRREWTMAAACAVLILGQIYFDLSLPDYMSDLTVLIKTPDSTLADILHTGLEMLGCTLASAVLCVICGYLTAKVAAQRINEVLETRNSLTQGTRTDAPEAGTVEFRDVSFHSTHPLTKMCWSTSASPPGGERQWPSSAPPAAARPLW